jgi:hypothetical protein
MSEHRCIAAGLVLALMDPEGKVSNHQTKPIPIRSFSICCDGRPIIDLVNIVFVELPREYLAQRAARCFGNVHKEQSHVNNSPCAIETNSAIVRC